MSIYRRKLMMAYAANKRSDDIVYPNLIAAWSAKGKTNDDEDRAILRDLTGNGHDITLNGFAFSEMSGYSGYGIRNLSLWNKYEGQGNIYTIINSNKISIYVNSTSYVFSLNNTLFTLESFTLKFDKPNVIESFGTFVINQIDDYTYKITKDENTTSVSILKFNSSYNKETVIIEQIPEYPDALVFDGVDDYGINEDMPILTDYTIIVKRINFEKGSQSFLITKSKDVTECITVENIRPSTNNMFLVNFGKYIIAPLYTENITFQTKSLYNNTKISAGDVEDGNIFFIGKRVGFNSSTFQGVFYSAYLFDRSLDEKEIKAFIRKYIDPEYLLPSEIPTPDCYYDFSQGSNDDETRDTIKDYSGNGNDAVAHNFAWNEEGSGYKDGALHFDGIDDYVSLDAFDSGFKSVFILCKPFELEKYLYDQRYTAGDFFSITNNKTVIAYNVPNNTYGVYINGIFNNTIKGEDLLNKKHLIIANKIDAKIGNRIPIIGNNNLITNNANANMALYKFLGFKEALTEEQIQYIIKKYNLLDGVDEIEVS